MSNFVTARQKMVDGQLRTSDVTDRRILDAMLSLPREIFVPEDRRALAYLDLDLDIGPTGSKRFLIKPMTTARLLQAAEIKPTDKVLIAGCATGYMAALAARLAAEVVATESDSALAARGNDILPKLVQQIVTIQTVETTAGWPAEAPFNVIVLNGATEITPEGLYQQLAESGRLVGVFASERPSRAVLVTRSHGDFGHRTLFDVAAPILPGLERRAEFVF
jgi:protein-L-isoaspartate(D-aspartate) O-methyltransferase